MIDSAFLKKYMTLPEELKALLRLKAILYYSAPTEILKACFARLSYLFPVKKTLSSGEFNNHLDKLKTYKLLDLKGTLAKDSIHFLTRDALDGIHAKDYRDALQTVYEDKGAYRFYHSHSDDEFYENALRLAVYQNDLPAYRAIAQKIPHQVPSLYYDFFVKEDFGMTPLSHPLADHPLADHPLADHPLADHPLVSHPLVSHPLVSHPLADHPPPDYPSEKSQDKSSDNSWLSTRLPEFQNKIFCIKVLAFMDGRPLSDSQSHSPHQIETLLSHYLPLRDTEPYKDMNTSLIPFDILSGNLTKARQTLDSVQEGNHLVPALLGNCAFLSNNAAQAVAYYETALKQLRKDSHKNKVSLNAEETIFYILALFQLKDRQHHAKIKILLDTATDLRLGNPTVFWAFKQLLLKLQGLDSILDSRVLKTSSTLDPVSEASLSLAAYWFDETFVDIPSARERFLCTKTILPIVSKIYAEILQRLDPTNKSDYDTFLSQPLFQNIIPFLDCVHMGEQWERALEHLDHFFGDHSPGSKGPSNTVAPGEKRLAWMLNPKNQGIAPLEQSALVRGGWSKGRPVALKRFYEHDSKLDYLTDDDRRVIKTIQTTHHSRWGATEYIFHPTKTLLALIGQEQPARL